ncbi:protein SLOW WALKER 1 [Iris pallida]|uniref:Protein SLOW WALKER 1 n=1 Tax=Iris pallida TaxID=29817 RepID=A0AAX6GJ73_IRIPA|nr:protein SLOW WALKER 1 [Iris pallida]
MAADQSKPFFPVGSTHPPRNPKALTPESKYWRSFRNSPLSTDLVLPVTSLEFSPAAPHDLAVSVSASVRLYGGSSLEPKPFSLTSFSDVAYSPSFRCDGKLLAAGGKSGVVQVFKTDKAGHAIRTLKAHTRPVSVVRYPRILDKLHLFSAGDDALLTYWDVPTEAPLQTYEGAHKEYIRAGSGSPVNCEVFATGSYDGSVKLWDVRVDSSDPVLNLYHGGSVASVLFLPSGGLIATAGGNSIKIWDVIGGGRLIHTMNSHNKTVTSMCLGNIGDENLGESRILSVSSDGYLKCFDFASFKVTHSMRYPGELLSVGFSPSGLVRVVGTSKGTIFIGKKKKKKEIDETGTVSEFGFVPEPQKKVLRPTNYRYFRRGQNEKPLESDYVLKRTPKVKLAEHDKLLKKFRHKEALLSALNRKNPNNTVAVMEELVARKKLLKCVANLDIDELGLLLGFLHRCATMPRYARFLMGLTKRVFELRGEDVLSSEELRCHVRNLKRMVAEEIKIQHSLQEIQGMISPLLAIAGR